MTNRELQAEVRRLKKSLADCEKSLDYAKRLAYDEVGMSASEMGKKGGKRRWKGMTAEERSRAARHAALARWRKRQTN